jgi:hypothetical protein
MPRNILRTESQSDYDKLKADFVKDLNPTDAIERRFVDEIVQYTWEMERYQRAGTGIHNGALRRAVALTLHEILLPPSTGRMSNKSLMSAQSLSYGWLLDPQSNRRVASQLEEAGYDESIIDGKALVLEADNIAYANRMVKSAQEGRDRAYRALAKYRKSSAGQLRQKADRVLAADQAEED